MSTYREKHGCNLRENDIAVCSLLLHYPRTRTERRVLNRPLRTRVNNMEGEASEGYGISLPAGRRDLQPSVVFGSVDKIHDSVIWGPFLVYVVTDKSWESKISLRPGANRTWDVKNRSLGLNDYTFPCRFA